MTIGSIIIRSNPVTNWENRAYCAIPKESPGLAELTFEEVNPEKRADGGDWSFAFRLFGPEIILKEIFQYGTDRHVEAWGDGLVNAFEGTIDEMVFGFFQDRFVINMDGVTNKGYMRVDYDGDDEVERSTALTNSDSQNRFGTITQVAQGAEVEGLTVADQAMQTALNWSGFPMPESDLGGGGNEMYLEVFCRGYWHTLERDVYNQTAESGTTTLSELVNTIIGDRERLYIDVAENTIDLEDGETADFDSISPSPDHELDFDEGDLSDFDSETDADGDLNASTDAAYLGSHGAEVTFDDANQAFGWIHATSVNRTEGVVDMWFDPHSVGLSAGEAIAVLVSLDGTYDAYWYWRLQNNGGTFEIEATAVDDSSVEQSPSAIALSSNSGYVLVRMQFKRSSGPGNDDGELYLYAVDGSTITTESITGLDNDTRDWDSFGVGMLDASQASGFSGSYYFDQVNVSESFAGPPLITPGAAMKGTYGMALTIQDATARYGQETSPASETLFVERLYLDGSGLTMSNGDEFIAYAATDGSNDILRIVLGSDGTNNYIYTQTRTDGGTYTDGRKHAVSGGERLMIGAVMSSASGEDDGITALFVSRREVDRVTGIDNDTLSITQRRFGAVSGLDSGTSGILKVDHMEWGNTVRESGSAEFIALKEISPNSTTVTKEYDVDRRPLHIIKSGVSLGDSRNNPWVAYVEGRNITQAVGRRFRLRPAAPATVQRQ